MKKRFELKALVLSLSVLSIFVFTMAFLSSCEKDSIELADKKTNQEFVQKEGELPPYREFVCGPPDPSSPYECPNASCPWLGWDCLFEIVIHDPPTEGASYNRYMQAASTLHIYTVNENISAFFINHQEEVSVLIPELAEPLDIVGQAMLTDLQNGVTSVRMHPVFHAESEKELYIIQVYVVETGGPPNYSRLL